jgi:hypothetical protein
LFAPPADPLWAFLGSLDTQPGRLLYEAAKLTAQFRRDPLAAI